MEVHCDISLYYFILYNILDIKNNMNQKCVNLWNAMMYSWAYDKKKESIYCIKFQNC